MLRWHYRSWLHIVQKKRGQHLSEMLLKHQQPGSQQQTQLLGDTSPTVLLQYWSHGMDQRLEKKILCLSTSI